MNPTRTLALAAAPALLIGLAIPAAAGGATAQKAPTARSACVPGEDQVLTAKQSLKLVKQCDDVKAAAKSWHWMGNYGSVYDVASVANSLGVGAGELITEANATGGGLIPTFMFY
jgi:hypothetical protein